jgi:peptidyl-prolyl cis-trans isomerase B (cyclophilin B)
MICGVVQFFGFWLLGTIPAIVLGHMARRQIQQRGEQGAGLALTGLILGYAGLALTVIVVIIIVIAVNSAPST